jgi:transposase
VDRIFAKRRVFVRKSESETLKKTVFSVLHQPPREYGFNRTTWNMKTLREALKTRGQPVGSEIIRQITRAAGYRWRKAKVVLTSHDPVLFREGSSCASYTVQSQRG